MGLPSRNRVSPTRGSTVWPPPRLRDSARYLPPRKGSAEQSRIGLGHHAPFGGAAGLCRPISTRGNGAFDARSLYLPHELVELPRHRHRSDAAAIRGEVGSGPGEKAVKSIGCCGVFR